LAVAGWQLQVGTWNNQPSTMNPHSALRIEWALKGEGKEHER
jgi:hypothetical protein